MSRPQRLERDDSERPPAAARNDSCLPCCDEEPDEEELGCVLPPLPQPDLQQMRSEASTGISVVACLIGTFIGLTYLCTNSMPDYSRSMFLTLVFAEAAVAILALFFS